MRKIIILAAGKGVRMNSAISIPKVLFPVNGIPMIERLIRSAIASKVDHRPIIVVAPDNKKLFIKALTNYGCDYVVQTEQLGTGHALACAKDLTVGADELLCLHGDHPLIKPETIRELVKNHRNEIVIATTMVDNFNGWQKSFWQWGRIIRNNGRIKAIIEFKDANDAIKNIKEVNPAIYRFNSQWLWENIDKIRNNNIQKEYYLTDLIKMAVDQGTKINSILINPKEAIGINTQDELKIVESLF
ncbi:MAG: NTP transferase domain-containing protein [Patescibacteria group bacterium]